MTTNVIYIVLFITSLYLLYGFLGKTQSSNVDRTEQTVRGVITTCLVGFAFYTFYYGFKSYITQIVTVLYLAIAAIVITTHYMFCFIVVKRNGKLTALIIAGITILLLAIAYASLLQAAILLNKIFIVYEGQEIFSYFLFGLVGIAFLIPMIVAIKNRPNGNGR